MGVVERSSLRWPDNWPALFPMLDVWLPPELCKIRNPQTYRLG
jgi:hypothetical protein